MRRNWIKFSYIAALSLLLTVTHPWSVMAQLSTPEFTDPQPTIETVPIRLKEAQDFLNPEKTPLLQSLVSCLPPRSPNALTPRFNWLTSWSNDAGETFHYINVYPQHDSGPPVEPSGTLIKANAGGGCENLLSSGSMASLTRYLPKAVAAEFAKVRFTDQKQRFPDAFNATVRAYATGGSLYEGGGVSPGTPMDDPNGCELFAEDAEAIKQMGYTVSNRCQVRQ